MTTRLRVSPHFVIEEFDCNDGTKVPNSHEQAIKKLCKIFLEPMREKFGACTVHSGFRTRTYNDKIGGARFSFHVYTDRKRRDGVAADVSFAKGSVADWVAYAKTLRLQREDGEGNGGIGNYPQGGFIHIDTRDYPADWNGS